ncbi:MAG: hypothetical protein AAF329_06480 [Cyanobacteria bacterium P01_A01_bin.17]
MGKSSRQSLVASLQARDRILNRGPLIHGTYFRAFSNIQSSSLRMMTVK